MVVAVAVAMHLQEQTNTSHQPPANRTGCRALRSSSAMVVASGGGSDVCIDTCGLVVVLGLVELGGEEVEQERGKCATMSMILPQPSPSQRTCAATAVEEHGSPSGGIGGQGACAAAGEHGRPWRSGEEARPHRCIPTSSTPPDG
jgi:hypothetical protein